jgi:transcriptional regulator with XRE-family HTH domain
MLNPESVAKGKRLKALREKTFLNQSAFAEKYSLNPNTYKSWELGRHGGLPLKRSCEIIQALKNEGIDCTVDWLIYGKGAEPLFTHKISEPPATYENSKITTEEQRINQELESFCNYYPLAQYLKVEDDGLYPFFYIGDLVAGIKHYDRDIRKVINLDCIVQIMGEERLLLRTVCQGTTKDTYNLVCKNPNTTVKQQVLFDVKLFTAAPIVWIRRKVDQLVLLNDL